MQKAPNVLFFSGGCSTGRSRLGESIGHGVHFALCSVSNVCAIFGRLARQDAQKKPASSAMSTASLWMHKLRCLALAQTHQKPMQPLPRRSACPFPCSQTKKTS